MPPALRTPGSGPNRDEQLLPTDFGSALRRAREHAGLTKKRLCELLAAEGAPIGPRRITAWEETGQEPGFGWPVEVLEQVLGLAEYTLVIRMTGRTRDQDADGHRRTAPAGWFDFVTTSVSQRVHVDADGRVAYVETTQRVRAMVSGATTYYFRYTQEDTERVRVSALSGCEVGNWWPQAKGLMQAQIMLEGDPMPAGDERTFRYRVDHTHFGRRGLPATALERQHRGNGTPTLHRLEMEAVFAACGCTVRQCTWINRHADPLPSRRELVPGRRSRRIEWRQPREHAFGIVWELPA